MKLISMKYR